jgi:hypothetical protein
LLWSWLDSASGNSLTSQDKKSSSWWSLRSRASRARELTKSPLC